MVRFLRFVVSLGVVLSFTSYAHSQCYRQGHVDCPTGVNVSCGGGVCAVWSRDPVTLVWIHGFHSGWQTEIRCSDSQAPLEWPFEISYTNATAIPEVYWEGNGLGNGFTNGPQVVCKRIGACNCTNVGAGNPCLTGTMVTAHKIDSTVIDTTETWCIEN